MRLSSFLESLVPAETSDNAQTEDASAADAADNAQAEDAAQADTADASQEEQNAGELQEFRPHLPDACPSPR